MLSPLRRILPSVVWLACLPGSGCGLLLDAGLDENATPDGAPVDAALAGDAAVTFDAGAPADALPGDASSTDALSTDATISPVACPGRYGVIDRVATLTGGISSHVDLAVDATHIAVVGRSQRAAGSSENLRVDFHHLDTLDPIAGGGGQGDMTPDGPPRIVRGAARFHIASLEELGLEDWTKYPGGISAPIILADVTAFGMTSDTDPARDVLMLVARPGTVHARSLPGGVFGLTLWSSLTPPSGHTTAAIDLTWDERNGAYAVAVGEEADGATGHVWYALVDADGGRVAAPVDLLVGAPGVLPSFASDPSRWGVRLTLAGDKAVVVYRLAADLATTTVPTVVDVALVDRATLAVTHGHLAAGGTSFVGAGTAAGPPGTFGIVATSSSGTPLFQLRGLTDGAVLESVALEGAGAAVAIVTDPTDLGDFLVARKAFASGDAMIMRIGCPSP